MRVLVPLLVCGVLAHQSKYVCATRRGGWGQHARCQDVCCGQPPPPACVRNVARWQAKLACEMTVKQAGRPDWRVR
eukprot:scaffold199164_cov21-Tisochrysis_lutea.AAC.1